jgi:hypothetical protein
MPQPPFMVKVNERVRRFVSSLNKVTDKAKDKSDYYSFHILAPFYTTNPIRGFGSHESLY